MSLERYTRQLGLVNQDWLFTNRFTIVGIGNLGSPLALGLTKMGVREVYLYDRDNIESHNLANQLFTKKDIGVPKINRMTALMDMYSPASATFLGWRQKVSLLNFTPLLDCEVMIVVTDNIESRFDSFILCLLHNELFGYHYKWFIEAGTHASTARMFVVDLEDPHQIDKYFEQIIDRKSAPDQELPCTERSTFFYANFISSVIMSYIRKISLGEKIDFEVLFDLANNQVYPYPLSKTDNNYTTKSMISTYYSELPDLYEQAKKELTGAFRLFSKDMVKSWMGPSGLLLNVSAGNLILKSLKFLTFTENRIDFGKHMIRVKWKKKDKQSHDGACEFCMCQFCGVRHKCDGYPCKSSRGCMASKKSSSGLGRVLYCDKINPSLISKQFEPLMDYMKDKDMSYFPEAIKDFFREYGGFDY